MKHLSDRQKQILKAMDIDIWSQRGFEHEVEAPDTGLVHDETPVPENSSQVEASMPPPTERTETQEVLKEPEANTKAEPSLEYLEQPAQQDSQWGTLDEIGQSVLTCRRCRLCENRTNGVPGEGSPRADWLFIGEGPGQNEDLQGRPFVGRAGQLLDAMIDALGMQREEVFIANVVKCRPPGNRDPKPDEVSACINYLNAQIDLIKPRVIVVLGRIAAQALLQSAEPLARLRGQVHYFSAARIPMVVTYHPAYLLRSPEQKSKAWDDLWKARTLTNDSSE